MAALECSQNDTSECRVSRPATSAGRSLCSTAIGRVTSPESQPPGLRLGRTRNALRFCGEIADDQGALPDGSARFITELRLLVKLDFGEILAAVSQAGVLFSQGNQIAIKPQDLRHEEKLPVFDQSSLHRSKVLGAWGSAKSLSE